MLAPCSLIKDKTVWYGKDKGNASFAIVMLGSARRLCQLWRVLLGAAAGDYQRLHSGSFHIVAAPAPNFVTSFSLLHFHTFSLTFTFTFTLFLEHLLSLSHFTCWEPLLATIRGSAVGVPSLSHWKCQPTLKAKGGQPPISFFRDKTKSIFLRNRPALRAGIWGKDP